MDDLTRRDAVKLAAAGGAVALGASAVAPEAQAQEEAQARAARPEGAREVHEAIAKATDEANAVFSKMGSAVEEEVKRGAKQLNVAEIARRAGLQIDARTLEELKIDPTIHVLPWVPWHIWWPWRPLWCWWWRRYPWYRCCPWWWSRCHWYVD